jgi:hypothetical protein
MSTSQNTWGSPSVAPVKSFAGGAQEQGGSANPTPNAASGSLSTRSYGMETAGWASPNGEADSHNRNTNGG